MADQPTNASRTAGDWQIQVKERARQGEYISAYDASAQGLKEHPEDLYLQHQAVLTLARSGAANRAQALLKSFDLQRKGWGVEDRLLGEDIAALEPRLQKDRALSATAGERRRWAAKSARGYQEAFERFRGYYTCINAATMWLVAGAPDRVEDLAKRAREICEATKPSYDGEGYWLAATRAEATLLLNDFGNLDGALDEAARLGGGKFDQLATTKKQLELICAINGIDAHIISRLKIPKVIHYCGHMISAPGARGRFEADEEERVKAEIADYLATNDVGFVFGSLACGADLLVAEAALARGAELNVVLPFDADEFKEISVERGGERWLELFDDSLGRAKSLSHATEDSYLGDDSLFAYCARLAMGLAVLRASNLSSEVEQLAIWDRQALHQAAGTAVDVSFWRSRGGKTQVIPTHGRAPESSGPVAPPLRRRVVRALLFGDVNGFSKLRELQLPIFFEEILGGFADVLDELNEKVLYRNTWGDGLYLVLDDTLSAARCALGLQQAMKAHDLPALGLPEHLGLRIGGHVGPVFTATDPVLEQPTFFGAHVTRTARIEPTTPEGEVYVTESFAALLALESGHGLTCEYVGHMPAAKGYGSFRMYVLKEPR